jgi:multiple sugar transport system permease protein
VKKWKKVLYLYAPLTVIMCFILFPFIWTFLTSIKNPADMFTKEVIYITNTPTLANYKALFEKTDFFKSMINSFLVAAITSILSLIVATMAGYSFSRYRYKGRKLFMSSFILMYMFPPVLFLIPLFTILKSINLLNTFTGLILAYCTFTIPFSIWLMTGFINDLPIELEEAAIIDGATKFQSILKIVIPLVAPGFVATGSYIFINAWNEYLFAVMFTNQKTQTLTVAIYGFITQFAIQWDLLTSGGIIAVIPVVIIFVLVQKKLIKGLTAGAVKG